MSETTCKRCGAKIKFLKTKAGKWLPVDPTPRLFWSNPDGKEKVMLQSGEVISCDLTGDAHHAAGEATSRTLQPRAILPTAAQSRPIIRRIPK